MAPSSLRAWTLQVVATMAMFMAMLWANDWLFRQLEYRAGINWVYLPAGVRLLATLLFAEAGALGLLLVSWYVSWFWFFPDDPQRAFAGGILASVAPWAVYRVAAHAWGLGASLRDLSARRLLLLALACSVASPLLHHAWFALRGQREGLLEGFVVMAVGDFNGTLIVLYGIKALLALAPRPAGH